MCALVGQIKDLITSKCKIPIEGVSTLTKVLCIELAYLKNPRCYAGGRVATGRGSLTGQDEGERSDEERYPGSPG